MDLLDWLFPESHELSKLPIGQAQVRLRNYQMAGPTNYHWIISVLNYADPKVSQLVKILKNRPQPRLLQLAGEIMYEHLQSSLASKELFQGPSTYLIIPIPSHKTSLRKRGFNQAYKIATHLAQQDDNFLIYEGLKKVRQTSKQALLRRSNRLTNMLGALKAKDPAKLLGKHIILVDDIVTTGATMNEAKKVLLAAGAASVVGCTLAYSSR